MAVGRITKSAVDGIHPGSRDKLLWDDKIAGFGVKVTPKGRKVYLYQYRIGGRGAKVRRYTIGPHGAWTADKARDEAQRLSMLAMQGIDPQGEKVERHRRAVELAFDAYVANRFVDECLKVKWPASWQDAERTLNRFAVPVLKSKPLDEITRQDVRAVLAPLGKMPATEKKVFAIMRRLFRWAVNVGDLEASPIAGMEGPEGAVARDRVLEDNELALVWKASEKIGAPFGPLVRLLILTGARREEVAGLAWSELRQDELLWKLPADRAKNGRANDIPLSKLAMAEIAAMSKGTKWPRRGLLFTTTGKTSVSGFSRAKKRLDAEIAKLNDKEALEPWTLHDLRRTLATGMQRLGVRFEVTEAILNHVSGSKAGVAGVYQRHDWAPEKRKALDAWARHIAGLLVENDKSNVVALADKRA